MSIIFFVRVKEKYYWKEDKKNTDEKDIFAKFLGGEGEHKIQQNKLVPKSNPVNGHKSPWRFLSLN